MQGKHPTVSYVKHCLTQFIINLMSLLRSMRSSLFKGMGIIYGGGTVYVEQIINRDDGEALRRDMEEIGNDMWVVIGRESDKLEPSDQQKHPTVSE